MLHILLFLIVLSILVLIHEAGHYFAARFFGVKAEEFGYGFPPRAIGFVKTHQGWKRVKADDRTKYANTVWSINWLPLGGFVRLKGEMGNEASDADSFQTQKGWQKFIILAAGVTMNWLFAAAIFSIGFASGVPTEIDRLPASAHVSDAHIEIVEVVTGSAADKAGFRMGDTIVTINGQIPANAEASRTILADQNEKNIPLTMEVKRHGELLTLNATPEYLPALDKPGLGVALTNIGTVRFPIHLAIVQGFTLTAQYTLLILQGFYQLIVDLFQERKLAADVSGPVGIAVLTGSIFDQGFWALMHFSAILSLNLAIINFLPIPALDGGRAVFVVMESIRRKRNNPRLEATVHQIGFVGLMLLILVVTANDISRYGSTIVNGIRNLLGL